MDFREINYVLAIAKNQNMTKAAEALYVSQPALSKFLMSLEAELGLKLFQRVGNKYLLTYAGEHYVEKAKKIIRIKADLDAELLDIKKNNRGILNVGFPGMRSFYVFPHVLPAFQEKYPNVQINIMEGTSAKLDENILEGELDLAFYSMPPERNIRMDYDLLGEEELLFCVQKDDPVKKYAVELPGRKYRYLDLKNVMDRTLLRMSLEQRTGQFVEELLQKEQWKFQKNFFTTSMPVIMELVSCGYGVSFLFEPHIFRHERNIPMDYYCFGKEPVISHFVAVSRKGGYRTEYVREFIELVREAYQKFLREKNDNDR